MVVAQDRELEGGAPSNDMGYVLDAARGSLEHQFAIAERLDAKARGQMTLAGAWFTVAQGVVGVVLGGAGLAVGWTVATLVSAAIAALGLGWAFYRHFQVWKLRDQPDLNPAALHSFLQDVRDVEIDAAGTILAHYAAMLDEWQAANHARERAFGAAVPAWFLALGLTLLELLVSVAAAILG
jgi:uncharacterized membrane protein YccF (DUF307 family)